MKEALSIWLTSTNGKIKMQGKGARVEVSLRNCLRSSKEMLHVTWHMDTPISRDAWYEGPFNLLVRYTHETYLVSQDCRVLSYTVLLTSPGIAEYDVILEGSDLKKISRLKAEMIYK